MRKFVAILIVTIVLMFAEYRFIMTNLKPYYAEDGFLCIEFMGQSDSYYAEPLFEQE